MTIQVSDDDFMRYCGKYVEMQFDFSLYYKKVFENGYIVICRDADTGAEDEDETEYHLYR